MKVIAVMPAYYEASRVKEAVLACKPHVDQVIVVDDGSKDATSEQAREAGAIVLRHAINRGQGAALKTGTLAALRLNADAIIHVDADGQHDPSFFPALLEPIKLGTHDVVFGSRFLAIKPQGMPLSRRIVLFGGYIFNTYLLGVSHRVTDPQSGFRAMSAQAAHGIDFKQDGYAHCSEILRIATRKLRWTEIPVPIRYSKETLTNRPVAPNALKIIWELLIGSMRR